MARILVIDDDDQTLRMMCDVLTRAGHEAVGAEGGRVGVACYRENPTDLVITDIIMPEQDGVETIREILGEFPHVKIIAVSGRGRGCGLDYPDAVLMLGAWRALDKPVTPKALLAAVAEALEGGDR